MMKTTYLMKLEVVRRGRRAAVPAGGVDVLDPPRDAHGPVAIEREQPAGDPGRVGGREVVAERQRVLPLEHSVVARDLDVVAAPGVGEHREDRAADPARSHPRDVEVAVRPALGDQRVVLARERIVVSVEDRQQGRGP